jgi:hypothetical protein
MESRRYAHTLRLPVSIELWKNDDGWNWVVENPLSGGIIDFSEEPSRTRGEALASAKKVSAESAKALIETNADDVAQRNGSATTCEGYGPAAARSS